MKINIYYGGRGIIDDPTLFVIDKLTEVLDELRVTVTRYNLYEQKNGLTTLPGTLKDADAVILAASVEWLGIGGYLHQFLDSCWLYADKERVSKIYMFPVAIAQTGGEREAQNELMRAWTLLGGISCEGICAYADNRSDLEADPDYTKIIEKAAEGLYRIVNQKQHMLPSSANRTSTTSQYKSIAASPQESEQLSAYVSDDKYVKRQKEDIADLTSFFSSMLAGGDDNDRQEYLKRLRDNYRQQGPDFAVSYMIQIKDLEKSLVVEVKDNTMNCYYGEKPDADVIAVTNRETMDKLVHGRTTFQGSFMSGEISTKGNFKMLRTFDQVFQFNII